MNRRAAAALGLLVALLECGDAFAWSPSTVSATPLKALKWSGGAVSYRVNRSHGSNVQGTDTDVQAAADASFQAWSSVSNTSLTVTNGGTSTATTRNINDGVNTLLFADTQSSATEAGLLAGALAVTFTIFSPTTGLFQDADIVFNTTKNFFTTTVSTSSFDLQAVLTHEIGHLLGLDHSSLLTATMYQSTAAGTTFQRALSADDIAGIRSTYPGTTALGKISGRIRNGGSGVLGASVFAIDTRGVTAAATLSVDSSGNFTIEGLPAGTYTLGVEPLDLPMQQGNLGGYFQVVGAFSTTFGTRVPQGAFVVSSGNTTSAGDLDVSAGTTAINPQDNVCIVDTGATSFFFGTTVDFAAGTSNKQFVVRHTNGITANTAVSVTGSDIVLGTATSGNLTSGVTFRRFPLTIPTSVASGGHTVVFTEGANAAVYQAGFLVTGGSSGNTAPTATASTTSTVFNLNDTVALTGSASDTDGDTLTYSWTPTSGTFGVLQNSTLLNAFFVAGGAGSFTFQLQASDGKGGSGTGSRTVRVNAPPVPAVTSSLTGTAGTEVTLSGTASDSDGDSITSYTWTQTGGTAVSLTGASTATARFTPAAAGTFTFTLAVRDSANGRSTSGTVTVTVAAKPNQTPVARATGLQAVLQDELAEFDGTSSSDADGDVLSFAWSQVSGPSTLSLGVTTRTTVGFRTSVIGSYVIRLTVTDPGLASSSTDVTIRVDRRPVAPTAIAGADRTVGVGATVLLDGSSSSDPNGQTLTYAWTKTAGPTITLSGAATRVASFVVATTGTYDFSLSVRNTDALTGTDFVRVVAEAASTSTTSIQLTTGLNIVSLPLQPATTNGAALTGSGLATLTDSTFVARALPGSTVTRRFDAVIRGDARSQDFEIEGNQAYVLSAPRSKVVSLTGRAWPTTVRQVALQSGANLVGVPGSVATTFTASTLASQTAAALVAERVTGAAGLNGSWRVVVPSAATSTFSLTPGRGYVVTVPAAVTITIPAP